MKPFIDWLYGTPVSQFLQTVSWIIPFVQTIHILCVAVLFSSMAMLDARLLGLNNTRHSTYELARRFLPWMWRTLPVLLLSGLILITAEPSRQLQNISFYIKMGCLLLAISITIFFQRRLEQAPASWDSDRRHQRLSKLVGATSLILWIAIIACGRLIAYT